MIRKDGRKSIVITCLDVVGLPIRFTINGEVRSTSSIEGFCSYIKTYLNIGNMYISKSPVADDPITNIETGEPL